MPCGIMDQYISVFGRERSAVEIDCRSLSHRLVPLPPGVVFVAVNSMVKHALAGSAYQQRVAECASAIAVLRRHFPQVESLRGVTPAQLMPLAGLLPEAVARRAHHVVTEDERVQRFVVAGPRGDVELVRRLIVE